MYQHGKRTRPPLTATPFLLSAAILGLTAIGLAVILNRDIANRTDPVTGEAIVTDVSFEQGDKLVVDEANFRLELPKDWKLQERTNEDYANRYIWVSTKQGAADRRLTLNIDIMPKSYKLVKMQPLIPSEDKFILGNLSDDCINFADPKPLGTAPVSVRWENVSFICDPIKGNQTIGTGSEEGGIATRLKDHSYFFYYEDHNVHPDSRILDETLRSFRAK